MGRMDSSDLLAALLRLAEGCSVLYVEDEADIRSEIAEMLETLFPDVVQAENGAQALELFQRRNFHLVVTDINMPVMSGIDFLRAVRELRPQQSVIVTSAHSDAGNLIPLINLGIGSFVLKPLQWKTFLSLVHKELAAALATEQEARYQQRLEKEVKLRTAELRDAQQQVVRLQEAKDNMLALISHELRTPLNGILGFIELIRTSDLPAEAAGFLDHVEDSARRLEFSTRKALDFTSLSTDVRSPKRERCQLDDLVRSARDLVQGRTDLVSALAVECPGGCDQYLDTDSELVIEILRNLFENSLKYAGPLCRITVWLEPGPSWSVLHVKDSGPGFPTAKLTTLFQPFSTGNIMHHSEGMGLGLALIDVIMLTLGGRVEALNSPEGGALVRLRFPTKSK